MLYNTIPRTALNDSFCSIINLSSHVAILTPAVLSTTLLFHFLHRYQGTFERVYPSFSPKKMHHIPPPQKKKKQPIISGYFWHQNHPFSATRNMRCKIFPSSFGHRGAEFTGAEGKRVTVWGGGGCMFFWATGWSGGWQVTPGWGGDFTAPFGKGRHSQYLVEKKTFSIPITQKFPNFLEG